MPPPSSSSFLPSSLHFTLLHCEHLESKDAGRDDPSRDARAGATEYDDDDDDDCYDDASERASERSRFPQRKRVSDMLGRFFKSKDDSAKQSSLPPGHRPGAGKPDEPPMGGGFFNLAPTVVKGGAGAPSASPGQTGPAPHAGAAGSGLAYQHRPSGTAPSGPAMDHGSSAMAPPAPTGGLFSGLDLAAAGAAQPAAYQAEDESTHNELAAFLKAKEKAFANQLKTTIAEQSYVMLQKQHNELEKSLSVHRNAIASAEAMIPQLEQEKKNAATQRNFKEAARISKDIKALEKDQATAEEMVEVVEMELQDLKERIVKLQPP
ncbi:hypothetical protein ATCC90586_007307 [Pythium insidiosum]|nr:hypothetical protein ATCC90586_007307 [Pythium insidiosum]